METNANITDIKARISHFMGETQLDTKGQQEFLEGVIANTVEEAKVNGRVVTESNVIQTLYRTLTESSVGLDKDLKPTHVDKVLKFLGSRAAIDKQRIFDQAMKDFVLYSLLGNVSIQH